MVKQKFLRSETTLKKALYGCVIKTERKIDNPLKNARKTRIFFVLLRRF